MKFIFVSPFQVIRMFRILLVPLLDVEEDQDDIYLFPQLLGDED